LDLYLLQGVEFSLASYLGEEVIVVDVGQAEGLGVVDEHGVREHDGKEAEPQLQSKELKVLSSEMDPDKIRFI
jgi:hypothetical protein